MPHTPGPWKIIDIPNADSMGIVPVMRPPGVKPRDLEDIASVSKSAEHYDAKANARLIAAAPRLLAACERVLQLQVSTGADEVWAAVKKAVAIATA